MLPRYVFRPNSQGGVFDGAQDEHGDPEGFERVDNITDHALSLFQSHYGDTDIDKDAIFFYVYGILNHPKYLSDHKDSLEAEMPRIPLAENFTAIRDLGYDLFRLHVSWASLEGLDLDIQKSAMFDSLPLSEQYRFTNIKFGGKKNNPDRTEMIINDHLKICGIPEQAHRYKLNGLSPLEWIAKMYVIRHDYVENDGKANKIKTTRTGEIKPDVRGIVNDPNNLFTDDYTIADLIKQAAQVAVETSALKDRLVLLEYQTINIEQGKRT